MNHQMVRVGWAAALVLALASAVEPAHAQVKFRLHGGVVQPLASAGDYFKFGPSVGVDFAYPLAEKVDVMLDLGWDYLNMPDIYASPTTNLWKYGVGVEGDLAGDENNDTYLVRVLASAGATTIRSHEFWLASRQPYTFQGETINQTSLTATGGVRLGLRTAQGLTWWLTGKLNWLPIQDRNGEALRELARNELDPLGSAVSASVTLGISVF